MIRLLAFFIALAVFVLWNWFLIVKKKRSPNHFAQQCYRTVTWGLLAGAFCEGSNFILIVTFFAFHAAFWLPFDLLLNKSRGLSWFYEGHTSEIDKSFWGKQWLAKLLFFVGGFLVLIFPEGI